MLGHGHEPARHPDSISSLRKKTIRGCGALNPGIESGPQNPAKHKVKRKRRIF